MATQEIIIGNITSLGDSIGTLPGYITRYAAEADQVEDVLRRVVISDGITLSNAGTLKKAINSTLKEIDAARRRFTDPLTDLAKTIKADFDVYGNRIGKQMIDLQAKMDAYVRIEQERLAKQAAKEAKEREEAALALAEKVQESGDVAGANKLLEQAQQITSAPLDTKVKTSAGVYGTTVFSQEVITGEISDTREFLGWASKNLNLQELEEIEVGKRLLNKLAKEGKPIPGLRVKKESKAR